MKDFSGYHFYSEYPDFQVAEPERREYLEGIRRVIARLRKESAAKREAFMSPESYRADPESYRKAYFEMLGWPLTEDRSKMPVPAVKARFVAEDEQARIYRMQLEVLPDFWFYGMYFVPKDKKEEKTGLVLCQHGGGGSPELCSDILGENNYHHMTRRVLDRGVRAFAPQILNWKRVAIPEPPVRVQPDDFNRVEIDNALKQMGSSLQALETFCLMRSLDYFCALPEVDENKIGMIGLSYGGFYTLMTAAAETRIVSAYSSCAMNDRFRYAWIDWSWKNSGNTFTDERVAALVAPRRFYGEAGREDPVFDSSSVPDYNALVKPFYAAFGKEDEFRFHIWEGGHKIDTDDAAGFDFFMEKLV